MPSHGLVDADVGPEILAVQQDVVPGVLYAGAVHVDEFTVEYPAVVAQMPQKYRQQSGEVGAVAGAGAHHLVGIGGDILVGIKVQIIAFQLQTAGFRFQLPPEQDLSFLQLLLRGPGELRAFHRCFGFVEIDFAGSLEAAAVGNDPVVDGQNLLFRCFTGGGDFFQQFLCQIIHHGIAHIDGNHR